MKPAWTPDFEIDAATAKQLIKRHFSWPHVDTLELLGIGWDNTAYLVNGKIVFRFPRRAIAAELMNTEMVYMPKIAAQLKLEVPIPTLIAPPTSAYPYPFSGHKFIPGVTACGVSFTHQERISIARPLASFLRELHNIEVTADDLRFAPHDELGRTDFAKRLMFLDERFDKPKSMNRFIGFDISELRRVAKKLANIPKSDAPLCWVHGDLYARHLLVDERRTLCGVIDWGDLHLGDSALDLSIAYSFLPDEARPTFFAEYGNVDETAHARARFRAFSYGVILLDYGSEIGDESLVAAGRFALKNALNCKV